MITIFNIRTPKLSDLLKLTPLGSYTTGVSISICQLQSSCSFWYMVLLHYIQPVEASNLICRINCKVKICGPLYKSDQELQESNNRTLTKAKDLSKHGDMNHCPCCTPTRPALPATMPRSKGIMVIGRPRPQWRTFSSGRASCPDFLVLCRGFSAGHLGRTSGHCEVAFSE